MIFSFGLIFSILRVSTYLGPCTSGYLAAIVCWFVGSDLTVFIIVIITLTLIYTTQVYTRLVDDSMGHILYTLLQNVHVFV